MISTCELRWFYRQGSPAAPIKDWFVDLKSQLKDDSTDDRSDYYLYLPGCTKLGVKYRAGMLETKEIHGEAGPTVTAPDGSVGKIERWVKVGGKVDKELLGRIQADLWPTGCWVEVKKQRTQVKFKIERVPAQADPVLTQIPISNRDAPDGCTVEFTELDVAGEQWWTVGLEAFGEAANQEANLRVVLEHVTGLWPGRVILEAEHSFGYPEWLCAVLAR